MRLEVVKTYSHADMEDEQKRLQNEYGGLDSLAQKAAAIGCTRPKYVDDYMTLRVLSSKNPSIREKKVFTGSEVFEYLSPRRMELLDHLKNRQPESITELAANLKRNYKNVYDDLRALEKMEMINMVRQRNRKVPRLNVTEIRIVVDGGGE
ncbi:MAG: helix-turn-helix domain-containing protein [Candidatus Thermoplasmatota archaeon]|nr:helix-turn-helix domain-containing protein [Candidatus Thermoplasmatota archaeon]